MNGRPVASAPLEQNVARLENPLSLIAEQIKAATAMRGIERVDGAVTAYLDAQLLRDECSRLMAEAEALIAGEAVATGQGRWYCEQHGTTVVVTDGDVQISAKKRRWQR